MIKTVLPLSLVLTLAACGGGGGSDNASQPETTAAVSADKYLGTWTLSCATSPLTRAGMALQRKVTYSFAKLSATQVSYTTFADIYDTPNCTGAALTRLAADPGTVQIDGAAVLNGASVDEITFSRGAWLNPVGGNIVSGGTITINGITYPGDFFVKPAPTKDVAQVTSTTMTFGNSATPRNAQGYPTGLSTNVYQKQ